MPITSGNPFKQTNWPNPPRRRRYQVIANEHFLDIPVTGIPFNQDEWVTPRKKRINPSWTDNLVFDNNLPPVAQHLTVPRGKSKFTPIIINPGILVVTAGKVVTPYSYPNPVIIKKPTLSLIINLLQDNLNPGVGEKPFNQNDHPNPLIKGRNSSEGWLQGKKTYYQEPPLQIGQYNWPVYRAVRRNDVGFIHYKLGTSEPNFKTVDLVPSRKVPRTLSHLDNLLDTITVIPGLVPFNQNIWTVPWTVPSRRKLIDIYTINGANYIVLPNIRGRVICLTAALTEFNLEAMLEGYDLNARADEFDLDAGGDECE